MVSLVKALGLTSVTFFNIGESKSISNNNNIAFLRLPTKKIKNLL